MAFTAASASSGEPMVTNANPRDLPVNLSIITAASTTLPNWANVSWRTPSVVVQARLPTNSLLLITVFADSLLSRLGTVSDYRISNAPPADRLGVHHVSQNAQVNWIGGGQNCKVEAKG
jgi:hypothetical protein